MECGSVEAGRPLGGWGDLKVWSCWGSGCPRTLSFSTITPTRDKRPRECPQCFSLVDLFLTCLNWGFVQGEKNYFASSDPHHGIQFIPSDILSGISSDILSGISSDILSGISSDILSGISSDILFGISSDILSGISSDILSVISSDILSGMSSDILSGISSDILFGISSDILSGISFGILFGILYGFVSVRWGPVKVRRGPRRAESRRLKSGEAHSAPNLAGWSPARPEVHCDQELADEVRRRPLRSSAGRGGPATITAIKRWQWRSGDDHCNQELADEVGRGRRRRKEEGERRRRRRSRASDIKSNNPHLAGGELSNMLLDFLMIWLGNSDLMTLFVRLFWILVEFDEMFVVMKWWWTVGRTSGGQDDELEGDAF